MPHGHEGIVLPEFIQSVLCITRMRVTCGQYTVCSITTAGSHIRTMHAVSGKFRATRCPNRCRSGPRYAACRRALSMEGHKPVCMVHPLDLLAQRHLIECHQNTHRSASLPVRVIPSHVPPARRSRPDITLPSLDWSKSTMYVYSHRDIQIKDGQDVPTVLLFPKAWKCAGAVGRSRNSSRLVQRMLQV